MCITRVIATFLSCKAKVAFCLILWSITAWSNPTNPQVLVGSASFNTNGNQLQVTASSIYTIIQWDDFSIQGVETTQFILPSSDSLVINLVVGSGNQMTTIDGLLTGNGKIWILNPNSFFVGASGTIEADSFLAATISLNVTNDQWYDSPNVAPLTSFFINQGTIRTTGGDLIFLCDNLNNDGILDVMIGGSVFVV